MEEALHGCPCPKRGQLATCIQQRIRHVYRRQRTAPLASRQAKSRPSLHLQLFRGMGQNSPGTRGSVFSRKRQSALTLKVSRKLFQSNIARLV
jgi:hypothetical protein